jgi:thiamine biosynthesis lipoprotein
VKILINILTLLTAFSIHAQMVYQEKHSLLGSPYEITVVVKDSTEGKKFADMSVNELKRIEQLISEWIPTSDISLVNQQAGKQPVKVHAEVFELLQRSVKFSKLTDGAFDVTWAGMDRIWKFDGSMQGNAIRRTHPQFGSACRLSKPDSQ